MKNPFETFGPFPLKREQDYAISTDDIKDFWDEVTEKEAGLESAIGVYIISVRHGTSSKPWYVGKTDTGFRTRLVGHAASLRLFPGLNSRAPKGHLEVLFIAQRTRDGKGFKSPRKSRRKSKKTKNSIDFLENLLIGACFAQNKDLLNVQKMAKYRDVSVPGLMNDPKGKPKHPAEYLRKLLA